MSNLKEFVESNELLSFESVKESCLASIDAYSEPLDLKNEIEDIEATICVASSCNRLDKDLESIGLIDILRKLYEVKSLFYTVYPSSLYDSFQTTEDALSHLMTSMIHQIIRYCDTVTIN